MAPPASLAREVNDEGHRARIDHPGRFGLLASLPLPDVDGAIEEIGYCYDELGVDGVCLLTNAGGVYLGDPVLEPVFDELDRRGGADLHPSDVPVCWEHTSFGRPRPMIEFLFDTTRAIVNMILNGTVARHPNIEIIVPHVGATLPMIADRVAGFSMVLPDVDPAADVLADLARLHYDVAGFAMPRALDALLTMTTPEHLHYGSDYPFTNEFVVEMLAAPLRDLGDPAGSFLDALADNTRPALPDPGRIGGPLMATEVILTGTGVPHARPNCAGAGTLVRRGDIALQFDAGRSTVMRLMEAGTPPHALTAVFLTHVHSDHVVGLPDLAMTRWIHGRIRSDTDPRDRRARRAGRLDSSDGCSNHIDEDMALRLEHVGGDPIEIDLRPVRGDETSRPSSGRATTGRCGCTPWRCTTNRCPTRWPTVSRRPTVWW